MRPSAEFVDIEGTDAEELEDAPRWMQLDRPWEAVQEDESGRLKMIQDVTLRLKKRRQHEETRAIRRGMQRYMFLVVDCSKSMSSNDLKPNRIRLVSRVAEAFIKEFFDQNPLSQLGVVVTHSSIAEKLSDLNGNPTRHIELVKRLSSYVDGEASLQNSLELARSSLRHVPRHGSREIVILMGSFTSVDPGDIYTTLASLKRDSIRCSVVGMGAEVHICRKLSADTSGTYMVALNEEHFQELVFQLIPPPPTAARSDAVLVPMGFPQRTADVVTPSLCVCHKTLKIGGVVCPRCRSRYCELPVDCQVCGLTLISSPHLARSYHHLFPVPVFRETTAMENTLICAGCLQRVPNGTVTFSCPQCNSTFCLECDLFIHESLHNCPIPHRD